MAKYTIVYFDGRGRAEPARLALAAAGKQFEDKWITFEKWPAEKPSAPQGRLPYMVIDGKKISQSKAILRLIGRDYKLYGKDDWEASYIDEVIDTASDLHEQWEKAFFGDEDKKEENLKQFKADTVPKFYEMLNNCVKEHGKKGFAVGEKLSIADCFLYNTVETADTECLSKYPELKTNRETVEKDGNVAKWLKSRPKSEF